jgi:hypothetical protein
MMEQMLEHLIRFVHGITWFVQGRVKELRRISKRKRIIANGNL